jgi:AcrR family transcriptional regulator
MTQKINTNEKIIYATLKLAETTEWCEVTMENIAKAANIEPDALIKNFKSKLTILDAYNQQLDKQMLIEFSDIKKADSIREQLFEILMSRFDTLNKNKIALKSIYKGTVLIDPLASTWGLKSLINSMQVALKIIGTPTSTPIGCVKTKILGLIFMRSFITWIEDQSPDMSKTMSKLDADLAKAELLSRSIPGIN